jgi:hypothetical protein
MLILVENVGEAPNNREEQGWCHYELVWWTQTCMDSMYGVCTWTCNKIASSTCYVDSILIFGPICGVFDVFEVICMHVFGMFDVFEGICIHICMYWVCLRLYMHICVSSTLKCRELKEKKTEITVGPTEKDHLVTMSCAHARQRATWQAPVLPGALLVCLAGSLPYVLVGGARQSLVGRTTTSMHGTGSPHGREAGRTAKDARTAEEARARQRMPHGRGSTTHGKVFAVQVCPDARQSRRCQACRWRASFAVRCHTAKALPCQ